MDELITQLTQHAGLSPAQARQAAEVALGFFRSRLPAPIAAQLEAVLHSSPADNIPEHGRSVDEGDHGGLGGLTKGIDGLLGR